MRAFLKILLQNSIFVVLLLGVLICANLITKSFSVRFDLTDEKEFTLSENTKRVLDRLEDRVTVKLFYSKQIPDQLLPVQERVDDLLAEYQAVPGVNLVVEKLSPDLNDKKEEEAIALGIQPLQVQVREQDRLEVKRVFMGMALYYKDKKEILPVLARVDNLEYMLDLALLKLSQDKLPRVGLVLGAEEESYQGLQELISQMGKLVKVDLKKDQVADLDLNLLVVASPQNLSSSFTEQLDEILLSGVSVMVFSGQTQVNPALQPEPVNSGLDDWLQGKNLLITNQLVVDPLQNAQAGFQTGYMQMYMPYPFWVVSRDLNQVQDEPITAGLEEALFPWTSAIQILESKESDWTAKVLAESSRQSFLQPEADKSVSPQYLNDLATLPTVEPMPLAVMVNRKDDAKTGRLLVVASSYFLEDRFLQMAQSNIIFFSNSLESLSWGDFLLGLRSRGKTDRPLKSLDQQTKALVKWGTVGGTILLGLLIGFFVLGFEKMRQKNLVEALT